MLALLALRIPKGDLALKDRSPYRISGPEYATQRITVTLDFFLAEWFLDTRQGVPYFRDVLIKNPNSETVRSVFRRAILKTPGIVAVPKLTYELDAANRVALIEFEAVYKDGQRIPQTLEVII